MGALPDAVKKVPGIRWRCNGHVSLPAVWHPPLAPRHRAGTGVHPPFLAACFATRVCESLLRWLLQLRAADAVAASGRLAEAAGSAV